MGGYAGPQTNSKITCSCSAQQYPRLFSNHGNINSFDHLFFNSTTPPAQCP